MEKYEKPVMEVVEFESEVKTFPCVAQNCSSDCIGQISGDVCATEWGSNN